jgi:hypothetical protein
MEWCKIPPAKMKPPRTIQTSKPMNAVSPPQFSQALAKQKALADKEWLQRCDALGKEQPEMFLELLTFPRDGLPADSSRLLIDYLATLQSVSGEISEAAAEPVSLAEFQASVKRTMLFFHALNTDDRAHYDRMMQSWSESWAGKSEVIWAGCMEVLSSPEIVGHPLFNAVVVTLSAIADVYARRLKG